MLLKAGKHDEVRSTTAPTAAAPFSTSHHIWLLTQARVVYQNATDLGTLNSPMQHPSELFQGLTAQPWHQVSTLRAAGFLESKYSIIKAEVLAALKQRSLEKEAVVDTEALTVSGKWAELNLFFQGRRFEKNIEVLPKTAGEHLWVSWTVLDIVCGLSDMIEDHLPEALSMVKGAVKVSIMKPGTRLSAHAGPSSPPGTRSR